jgi:hypothetical protein
MPLVWQSSCLTCEDEVISCSVTGSLLQFTHSEISWGTKRNIAILKVNTSFHSLCCHKWNLNIWIFKYINRWDDKGDRFSPLYYCWWFNSCRFHSYDKTTEILIRIIEGFTGKRLEMKHGKMEYSSGCSITWYFINFAEWINSSLQTRINVTIHVTQLIRKKCAFYLLYDSVS